MPGVLVVVHRELRDQQVGGMPEDVPFEAKGSAVGACGREAEVKGADLGPGILGPEPIRNEGAVALGVLGDGSAESCDADLLPPSGLGRQGAQAGPTQVNPERELLWLDAGKGLGEKERGENRERQAERHEFLLPSEREAMASSVTPAKSFFSIKFLGVTQEPPTVRTASSSR